MLTYLVKPGFLPFLAQPTAFIDGLRHLVSCAETTPQACSSADKLFFFPSGGNLAQFSLFYCSLFFYNLFEISTYSHPRAQLTAKASGAPAELAKPYPASLHPPTPVRSDNSAAYTEGQAQIFDKVLQQTGVFSDASFCSSSRIPQPASLPLTPHLGVVGGRRALGRLTATSDLADRVDSGVVGFGFTRSPDVEGRPETTLGLRQQPHTPARLYCLGNATKTGSMPNNGGSLSSGSGAARAFSHAQGSPARYTYYGASQLYRDDTTLCRRRASVHLRSRALARRSLPSLQHFGSGVVAIAQRPNTLR
jgi:hypothetical protein